MAIPSSDHSLTSSLTNKIESWRQPTQHWSKREILTRAVSVAATTAFSALDIAYNGVSAIVKLPFATFKGTVGRIHLPFVGKFNERMPNELGMTEVGRHALKVGTLAINAFFGPVVGLIHPNAQVRLAAKLGITHTSAPVVVPAVEKAVTPAASPVASDDEADESSSQDDDNVVVDASVQPSASELDIAEQPLVDASNDEDSADSASADDAQDLPSASPANAGHTPVSSDDEVEPKDAVVVDSDDASELSAQGSDSQTSIFSDDDSDPSSDDQLAIAALNDASDSDAVMEPKQSKLSWAAGIGFDVVDSTFGKVGRGLGSILGA